MTDTLQRRELDRSVTERVVRAVAAQADADPLELPPLYAAVDPDALAALCDHPGDAVLSIEFPYGGYLVTVERDGGLDVSVDPCDETAFDADGDADATITGDCGVDVTEFR